MGVAILLALQPLLQGSIRPRTWGALFLGLSLRPPPPQPSPVNSQAFGLQGEGEEKRNAAISEFCICDSAKAGMTAERVCPAPAEIS